MGKFIITGNYVKKSCRFCGHITSSSCLSKHENHCYLNPNNIILCPICEKPIKNYKSNTTCSYSCSNTYFRTGKDHPNWKSAENYSIMDSSISELGARKVCFAYHEKKCIICSESLIVEAHHYDGNKNNNNKNNFVPLCPTHHRYWHSNYRYLIKKQVDDYVKKFKLSLS